MTKLGTCLALGAIAVACGASTPAQEPAAAPAKAPTAEPGSPDSPKTPASGTATPNPPAACDYRVGQTCYATEAEACSAAGCPPGGCVVLESYPAQITCK